MKGATMKGKLDPSVRQLMAEKHRVVRDLVNEFKTRRKKLDEDSKKLDVRKAQLDAAEEAAKRERADLNRQLAEMQSKATASQERILDELETLKTEKTELENLVNQMLESLKETS
jgi:DNA anti-recombination protein RmuC